MHRSISLPLHTVYPDREMPVFSPLPVNYHQHCHMETAWLLKSMWNEHSKRYQVLVGTIKITQGIKFGSSLLQHHQRPKESLISLRAAAVWAGRKRVGTQSAATPAWHRVCNCGDKEECAAAIPEKVLFLDLHLWGLQKNSYWLWPIQCASQKHSRSPCTLF